MNKLDDIKNGCLYVLTATQYRYVLTATQYKYYIDYYFNGMLMADISLKYGVHKSTVSRVLQNARNRLLKVEV